MQGYILRVQKVKEEDLLVFILSTDILLKTYRFYGARHPSIMVGNKIDFELVKNVNFLPQLRNVMHLGFKWQTNRQRVIIWQNFIRLLYAHLRDAGELDEIYFNELDAMTHKFGLQNPKRLIIETYTKILAHEGRLHDDFECFLCDEPIANELCLARGFLPAHTHCLGHNSFDALLIKTLFKNKSCVWLNDEQVDKLYQIVCEGF
ncbi:MAG: recombination protein RecO [Campylobacter sp.]|nr:recombination protein RecO [Campylobacter sp.]